MTFEQFVRDLATVECSCVVMLTANDYSATLHFVTAAGTRQILITENYVTMSPDLEVLKLERTESEIIQ